MSHPVFGTVPNPLDYVDPDTIDPIIFGPPPRPYDFVDPALEEPVIFGPLPRPANYIEPEDIDNLISMEDDTTLGGFHEETHVGPDDGLQPQPMCCSGHDQDNVSSEVLEDREEVGADISESVVRPLVLIKGEAPMPGFGDPCCVSARMHRTGKASKKNSWCEAHNGNYHYEAVKAKVETQLIENTIISADVLKKDSLLSAKYNLFRPTTAITGASV
ncbi:hypothetical protein Tco_1029871 [Tanacetum coccineum]|uniref:Uncharacterized protein n=1 Tax=Tanacetum coccineum TaxID=301880 RepID=A0ABQ5G4Y7_9ASTR